MVLRFPYLHDRCTSARVRSEVKQNLLEQIVSIDSNTERLGHNLFGRETNAPIGSSSLLASLHFLCCEMHAMLNAVLSGSLF